MLGIYGCLSLLLTWTFAFANANSFLPRFENISTSAAATCEANCVAAEIVGHYAWQNLEASQTLVAATIVYVVNNRTNTTSMETVFNDLPAGTTLPPVNAEGTHVATATVTTGLANETTVVTLAYPTAFERYPLDYHWYGTLPTIDAMGSSICSTAKVTDKAYVTYNPYATPAQDIPTYTDTEEPKGHLKSLMYYGCCMPADATLAPEDAAPTLCRSQGLCGIAALPTVQFLTETSTRHEDKPAPTPTPTPTPTPPTQAAQQNGPATTISSVANNNTPSSKANGNVAPPAEDRNNATPTPKPTPAPTPIVIGSQTFTANSQTAFVIASQTLFARAQITVSGTTVSLAQGASIAIVNGATQSLITPSAAVLTLGGRTITADAQSQFVVDGETLGLGSTITVGQGSGRTTVALTTDKAGVTVAVVDGVSATLSVPGKTAGVGGAIVSGIGGAEQFQGDGVGMRMRVTGLCVGFAFVLPVIM